MEPTNLQVTLEKINNTVSIQDLLNLLNLSFTMEMTLYLKTLGAHWNVRGENFSSLHALFKDQYEELFTFVDNIAEQIMMIDKDMRAICDLQYFATGGGVLEARLDGFLSATQICFQLEQDHTQVLNTLQTTADYSEKLRLFGITDLVTSMIRSHDKMRWFLRSHQT